MTVIDDHHATSSTVNSSASLSDKGFFKVFVNAKGSIEVLAVSFFLAFGIGCVIGVVSLMCVLEREE
jgi:ABC-type nitrate/sulfonate/bicarbonate transport system permease component